MADHRPQGERPASAGWWPIASPISASPASGTAGATIAEYNADQGVHHHRSAGLSARADGAVQGVGRARQVRPARRLAFAGQAFNVRIRNPKGEKVFEQELTRRRLRRLRRASCRCPGAPRWASTASRSSIRRKPIHGGGTFRVEEYKKPEFEVTVEAPKEPVTLGEKITATIKAKYYFGAPVTSAKVKYKVLRTAYSAAGIRGGAGIGSTAAATGGSPPISLVSRLGATGAACGPCPLVVAARHRSSPRSSWRTRSRSAPTARWKSPSTRMPAKELHGDQDHKYSITAEVTDESRRTIVGTGNVLVARKPFKVFAWVESRPLPRRRHHQGRLQRPDAGQQAGRGQGRADACTRSPTTTRTSRSRRRCRPGSSTPTSRARPASRSRPPRPGSTGCPTS